MPAARNNGSLGQTEGLVAIDDGTLARTNTQPPSVVGAEQESWWSRHFGHHVSTWLRARCLIAAYRTARERAPEEIEKEIPGVSQAVHGVLQGMLQMLLVVGLTTTVGAVAGGVIGAFFGGVGAVPGVVEGGAVGLDVGLAVLTWLGVGFLVASIVSDLGQLVKMVESAAKRAWGAAESPEPLRTQQTRAAGMELAGAVAILVRLIFEAIVAYLLKKGGAITKEGVGELVAKLRKSRLGTAMADYVEKNWKELVDNPKLRPKPKLDVEQKAGGGSSSNQKPPPTPPKPEPPAAPTGPSKATKVVNLPETTAPHPVKPENVRAEQEKFLGPKPYSNTHPRTGDPDPSRTVSADGTRSVRYGDHEKNSGPTKHHYHEETWSHDPASDTMTVGNTIKRVPLPKPKPTPPTP